MSDFTGVDLHALDQSTAGDEVSGSEPDVPAENDLKQRERLDWVPDWTRSALDELLGPLAETAAMIHMSAGQSDELNANVGGK